MDTARQSFFFFAQKAPICIRQLAKCFFLFLFLS
ncbi:hypothetical protein LEMLEM_LOCUS18987 [Lemmus lemmus]